MGVLWGMFIFPGKYLDSRDLESRHRHFIFIYLGIPIWSTAPQVPGRSITSPRTGCSTHCLPRSTHICCHQHWANCTSRLAGISLPPCAAEYCTGRQDEEFAAQMISHNIKTMCLVSCRPPSCCQNVSDWCDVDDRYAHYVSYPTW